MKTMAAINISLTKQEKEKFQKLCKTEIRGPSDMFRFLMQFYLDRKDQK